MNIKNCPNTVCRVASTLIIMMLLLLNITFCKELANYTGTFSSFEYHEESGDLLGIEIRIVFAQSGYVAIIQIAEGSPSDLMISPVSFKDNRVDFEIKESQSRLYSGTFSGKIDENHLKGILKLNSGNRLDITLPRKKSYWD